MFRNYLKTALRNLLREKGSSLLNIAGLTLGITSSLVLFLLIRFLATFDDYHANKDRIYRVVTEMDSNSERFYTPGVPTVLPDAFRQEFPEAEEVTFTSYRSEDIVRRILPDGEMLKFAEERGIVFAEPSFFKIFDRKVLSGDPLKALDEPREAIISVSLAKKYFGREDVIGEIVKFDSVEYTIKATMEDAPGNTDFPFSLMLSYVTIKEATERKGWGSIWSDEQCYILLREGATPEAILERMPDFVKKYLGEENYQKQTFSLQPLRELHFDTRFANYTYQMIPKETLIALGVVAVFLIVTACINFVNLTTAEAVKRSKEVGIRKSLGSTRRQLITQFLGETTMITTFAMLLSIGLVQIVLSFLNPFLELSLEVNFKSDAGLWIFVLSITVLVSLMSGMYPSLLLSRFNPVTALKQGMSRRSPSGFDLRRSLVVVQFVISQFFIMGTIVLLSQMNYFRTRDLGFRQDAVLVMPIPEREFPGRVPVSKMRTLRDEIATIAGVEMVSISSSAPSSGDVQGAGFFMQGEDRSQLKNTHIKHVDSNYLPLFDIQLIAGRNVDDLDTVSGAVVNERFVNLIGASGPEDALGRNINLWGRTFPIQGVVRDFHTVSLRDRIEPAIMMNDLDSYRTLTVRVNTADIEHLIAQIRSKWEAAYPAHIFEYEFLDENIRQFYEEEQRLSVLLTVFTFMAIFIGCLGLFGLASFMTNQRTKEIGVRKVLGASVESIILLFSSEYIKLILLGFVIAAPAAWYLMNQWLDRFAYKITIGPMVFFTGLFVTFTIAVLTVGYKSFKAAVVNPVKSLRYE